MVEDHLKELFEELNIQPRPRTFGAVDVIHHGQEIRNRRRRLTVAGSALGTTALVVVVGFALAGTVAPPTDPATPPAPAGTTQPVDTTAPTVPPPTGAPHPTTSWPAKPPPGTNSAPTTAAGTDPPEPTRAPAPAQSIPTSATAPPANAPPVTAPLATAQSATPTTDAPSDATNTHQTEVTTSTRQPTAPTPA